jgi:prephenate dehydratase
VSGGPDGARAVPLPTIPEVVAAVRSGAVDRAVVPIENSLEGAVNATLDSLALDAQDVVIVGESVLAVRPCLIARTELALEDVEVVVSHPQPLAQCARFLRERLPGAAVETASSTAEAVRRVASSERPVAALGTRRAAELYRCRVLADGVEDVAGNETRFVWLARAGTAPPACARTGTAGGRWKTSIVFSGGGDAEPGWLVRCLQELSSRGVNLTRIESRPRRIGLGHYMFFADCDGRADDPGLAEALDALRRHCDALRLLGSYPAAARGC